MNSSRTCRHRRGFTLIEVLVVVAIIALLAAVLLPSLKAAREAAYRAGCGANFHSIGQSMAMYAEDTRQNWYMFNRTYNFAAGTWNGISAAGDNGAGTIGDDSVVAMALDMKTAPPPGGFTKQTHRGTPNKKYIRSWELLICPATRNEIRWVEDLNGNADARDTNLNFNYSAGSVQGQYGHSYEWWSGFQKYDYAGPGGCGTGSTKYLYTNSAGDTNKDGFPDCLKRPKILKYPARIILVLDGDDPMGVGATGDINNWPDSPNDNHGDKGWQVLFADMHARWVTREQTFSVLDRSDMDTSHVPEAYRRRPGGGGPPPG